jgi:hypothetical protein
MPNVRIICPICEHRKFEDWDEYETHYEACVVTLGIEKERS